MDRLATVIIGGIIGTGIGGIIGIPFSMFYFNPFSKNKFEDISTIITSFATSGFMIGVVIASCVLLCKYGYGLIIV